VPVSGAGSFHDDSGGAMSGPAYENFVMPGLDPGIHGLPPGSALQINGTPHDDVDGRVEPGHDGLDGMAFPP
jgi:hypothetical protein